MPENTASPMLLGWFQIGWSDEIASGGVRALRFFGHDLVAYRQNDGERQHGGELVVLDGHCLHLGAHLGHGGCVDGDGIICPFHRWRWGPDGVNTRVPDSDRPNLSARLRVWPHDERHGCIYLWHGPEGEAPRWPIPDAFTDLPDAEGCSPSDHYAPYPHGALRIEGVKVDPRVTADNAVDNRHFDYVHETAVMPELVDWRSQQAIWRSVMDFRSPHTGEVAARLNLLMSGVGIVFTQQAGKMPQRVSLSTTPVEDGLSDLLLTTWIRKQDGDPDGRSPAVQARYAAAAAALPQDIDIWRHQRYADRPLLAPYEGPLAEFRKWTRRFDSFDSE